MERQPVFRAHGVSAVVAVAFLWHPMQVAVACVSVLLGGRQVSLEPTRFWELQERDENPPVF